MSGTPPPEKHLPVVRVADLADDRGVIENRTLEDVELRGPAVVVARNVSFVHVSFGIATNDDPNSILGRLISIGAPR
jgi:hypothetical protein